MCFRLYEREQSLFTFSVAWTKLDSAREVNHADILVKLGQKGFPDRDFQSEAYIPSSISTDAERKFITLRQVPVVAHSWWAKVLFFYSFDSVYGLVYLSWELSPISCT